MVDLVTGKAIMFKKAAVATEMVRKKFLLVSWIFILKSVLNLLKLLRIRKQLLDKYFAGEELSVAEIKSCIRKAAICPECSTCSLRIRF